MNENKEQFRPNIESQPEKVERVRQIERELMELKGEREKELERRKKIANELISEVGERLGIVGWNISGSTAREDFAFSSDLDIDILLERDLSDEDSLYLNHYLVKRTLEKEGIFIQFNEFTLEQINDIRAHNIKMYQWYKEHFGI